MIQVPIAIGLKVCQNAIVEEKTRNVTLVNCFRRLRFRDFPSPSRPFTVCAVVRNGRGVIRFSLAITPLSTWEDLWTRAWSARFDHPLQEMWFMVPIADLTFPEPGRYEVRLMAEGEMIAQNTVEVLEEE